MEVKCLTFALLSTFIIVGECVYMSAASRSHVGAVGPRRGRGRRRGREGVRRSVVAERRGALQVGGQRQGHGRVLVVGVEAQALAAIAHAVWEAVGAGVGVGVRRAGGAVVVVAARVQLVQGDRIDGHAVHSQGVAGIAGEVGQRVGLVLRCTRPRRAHVGL